jgi:ankyrin repeat protein
VIDMEAQKIDLGKCTHDSPHSVCTCCCLHLAVNNRVWQCVQDLLAAGADPNLMWTQRSRTGLVLSYSPLHECARGPTLGGTDASDSEILPKIVGALVSRGADINQQNELGQTPLQLAAINGRIATVNALLQHSPDLSITADEGNTALHLVVVSDIPKDEQRIAIVQALLAHGADLSAKNQNGKTAGALARRERRSRDVIQAVSGPKKWWEFWK